MKNPARTMLKTIALSLALSAATPMPATAQQITNCLPPSAVGNLVASGQIIKLADALSLSGQSPSSVVNQSVCTVDGELAYVFDIVEHNGNTRRLILRGRDGTPIG